MKKKLDKCLDNDHCERRSDFVKSSDLPANDVFEFLHSLRRYTGDDIIDTIDHVGLFDFSYVFQTFKYLAF